MYFGDEIEEKLSIYDHRGDRCSCGASAIVTGPDGYCDNCTDKRENFINEIIGTIDMKYFDEIAGFKSSEIEVIEKLRKMMLRRELRGLIDIHFSIHNRYSGNYVEPYENPSFLSIVHEKKQQRMKVFLGELNNHSLTVPPSKSKKIFNDNTEAEITKKLNCAFIEYQEQLKKQMEIDRLNINKLIDTAYSGRTVEEDELKQLVKNYKGKIFQNSN